MKLLELRDFGGKRISWTQQITHGGSVGVKLNNRESDFFLAGKGLRQGDPISPLLFNLLGIPLHNDKLRREDIQPLLDKIIKRIAGGGANFSLTEVD